MSQSTRGFGFGRRSGTVTIIEQQVHRSSARNARMAFIITYLIVAVLSATVASDHMHPILAGLLGAFIAFVVAGFAWTLVRIWPVLRLLWWWAPEISAGMVLVYGWIALANATPAPITLAVMAPLVGIPATVPAIRRRVIALGWCFIVRHRLRVCFSQFIIANRSGSLPLILWARPTPVGERVWVYLRAGFSLRKLTERLDEIAVACHADSALVERASKSKAAYLRFDIKRREVLTAKVSSPLPGLIDTDGLPDAYTPPADGVPTALDLPDVPAETPLAKAAKSATGANGKKPAKTTPAAAPTEPFDVDPWD